MDLHALIVFFFNLGLIFSLVETNCWKKVFYSTKTSYELSVNNGDAILFKRPGGSCKPIHINMVHRHGNRYPSTKDIKGMHLVAKIINEAVNVSSELPLKRPWKCPFTEAHDKLLSTVGESELYGIGKSIVKNFPEIFEQKYSPLLYSFESTCKLRCTHSANALALGIFEDLGTIGKYKSQPIAILVEPCDHDLNLRFFDLCKKYIVDVEDNKTALLEKDKFDKGPEMKKVLHKVAWKLGLPDSSISAKDLKSIYVACAYDLGMFHGASGICSLLDEDELSVMEYSLDLKHFYKHFTAFKISFQSSCPLLKTMVESLKSAASNSTASFVGIFRSAHAETLIPLYALLGLYTDKENMLSSNYEKMKNRNFRPACMTPFAGHIYFVLYQCEKNEYKIQMYVNERLTKIPCCESAEDCDFKTFLNCYEKVVNDCHFDQMCKLDHSEL